MPFIPENAVTLGEIRSFVEEHKPSSWPPPELVEATQYRKHFLSDKPESFFYPDSEADLQLVIEKLVEKSDRVLTTPQHAHFFREFGVDGISVYDMSPAQLTKCTLSGERRYWVDVYNSELLSSVLGDAQPTLLYLSNITEWSYDGSEQVELLAKTLDSCSSLNKVIVSKIVFNNTGSDFFVNELEKLGWKRSFSSNNKIISVVRS